MKNHLKLFCSYFAIVIICVLVCFGFNTINDGLIKRENYKASIVQPYKNTITELQNEISLLKAEVAELKAAEEERNLYDATIKKIQPFLFPLDDVYRNNITSIQGLRTPISLPNAGGTTSGRYHNALDVAVPDFTPVKAAKEGRVTVVYPSYYNGGKKYKGHPQYGGYVEITHDDGTKTIYAHLSMTSVREGQIVKAGQKIGNSGGVAGRRGSGTSTGPHLHFEVILNINDMFIE